MRRQEGCSEPVIGLGAGYIMQHMPDQANSADGQRCQDVVIARHRDFTLVTGRFT
jgi:hypothetical protein